MKPVNASRIIKAVSNVIATMRNLLLVQSVRFVVSLQFRIKMANARQAIVFLTMRSVLVTVSVYFLRKTAVLHVIATKCLRANFAQNVT